jgi:glycosyltransferase involved in cell wall biosynthesis
MQQSARLRLHVVLSGMFWPQPTVGMGQYLHGLLAWLPRLAPDWRFTVLLPAYLADATSPAKQEQKNRQSERAFDPITFVPLRTPFDQRNRNLAKLWFEQVAVPQAARRLGADLLHVPYFAPPAAHPAPLVVTIPDIVPLALPEYRGRALVRAYMRVVAALAPRADSVITLSEHARGEIVRVLRCDPARVTPIYLAPDAIYAPQDQSAAQAEVARRYGLHAPFIYYVGGLDARKNVALLIRVVARLHREGGLPATLALAGRALGDDPLLFPDLDRVIAEEQAEAFVRRIDVPRADNPLLYAAATVAVYPSRYEGFGLPPLEAMACGTPVIVSNATSLPEVVGDAAILVAPDDLPGWTQALKRVLEETDLRAALRTRGLAQAACFSYEQCAHETLAVYARTENRRTNTSLRSAVQESTGLT